MTSTPFAKASQACNGAQVITDAASATLRESRKELDEYNGQVTEGAGDPMKCAATLHIVEGVITVNKFDRGTQAEFVDTLKALLDRFPAESDELSRACCPPDVS